MENKNSQYIISIVALVVAVVGMSIAFAFQDVNLSVTGNVTTKSTKWDVHFKEIKNQLGVTPTTAATIGSSDTLTASYTVTLSEPGDYYQFDIVVVNAGDFDAQLSNIALTNTDSVEYMTHSVTYSGTTYTAASTAITGATILEPDDTETFTVKIKYDEPTSASSLPSDDSSSQTYTVTLTYKQAAS